MEAVVRDALLSTGVGYALSRLDDTKDSSSDLKNMIIGARTAVASILLNMAFGEDHSGVLLVIPLAVLATHCSTNRTSHYTTALTQASNAISVIALVYFNNFLPAFCLMATYGFCLNKDIFGQDLWNLIGPPQVDPRQTLCKNHTSKVVL